MSDVAGLHCRGLYLQYGKGHVSLLRRSAKCEVPEDISPITDLIAVLVVVWQIRVSSVLLYRVGFCSGH